MKSQTSKFYPDVVLQALFVLPMLLCYFLSIFRLELLIGALLIQIGVGAVQVLSGIFHAVVRKSRWHTIYFISALLYLLFLGGLLMGVSANDTVFFVCIGIFNCLIPVGIAIWYLHQSWQYHKNYLAPLTSPQYGEEDLLDDLMMEN